MVLSVSVLLGRACGLHDVGVRYESVLSACFGTLREEFLTLRFLK